jgi:ATP/maltotriose-dependent transcriptional regulator MalT
MREQDVLQLLGNGCSNGEIAAQLHISESTVKTHLSNIYAKLSVNNRVQAITRAKALHLILRSRAGDWGFGEGSAHG